MIISKRLCLFLYTNRFFFSLLCIFQIEDCTLQIYRQNGTETEYCSYLDLEQTLEEQGEEFEQLKENSRTSILLRTQLSVRVHTCIGKCVLYFTWSYVIDWNLN